jgi:hypothetical protein
VDYVDLGFLFHVSPQEIYETWDEDWVDRIHTVIRAREMANIAKERRKRIDGD